MERKGKHTKRVKVIGYWVEWQHVCLESGGDEIKRSCEQFVEGESKLLTFSVAN